MKTVICLSGKRNSGKTTAEHFILEQLDGAAESYQMATLLKKVVCALTNCTPKDLDHQGIKLMTSPYKIKSGDNIKELTYRELLIHMGKILRKDNNDIFIEDVLNYIKNSNKPCIVIPDVREKREIQAIEDYCFDNDIQCITIRINRPMSGYNDDISNDKTEIDLDDYNFDHVIRNDKSINDMNHELYLILWINNVTLKHFYEQNLF